MTKPPIQYHGFYAYLQNGSDWTFVCNYLRLNPIAKKILAQTVKEMLADEPVIFDDQQ